MDNNYGSDPTGTTLTTEMVLKSANRIRKHTYLVKFKNELDRVGLGEASAVAINIKRLLWVRKYLRAWDTQAVRQGKKKWYKLMYDGVYFGDLFVADYAHMGVDEIISI